MDDMNNRTAAAPPPTLAAPHAALPDALAGRPPDSFDAASGSEFIATADPLWLMMDDEFAPSREHEFESLFSVANGYLGARGSLPLGIPLSAPTVFIAGVYARHPPSPLPELLAVPGWTLLSQTIGSTLLAMENLRVVEHYRMLDMRQGIFRRDFRFADAAGHVIRIRFLRIASLADRHVLLQSSLCTSENYSGPMTIRSGFLLPTATASKSLQAGASIRNTPSGPIHVFETRTSAGATVALAVASRFRAVDNTCDACMSQRTQGLDDVMEIEVEAGKTYRNDWLEVCYTSRDTAQPALEAPAHLQRLLAQSVTSAVRHHALAWDARWRVADIEIDGDAEAQRALRFACYHLISAVNPDDEHVSIGARALTGPAYKGHVFWDTEIFLLPFYALTDPRSARALLMYRFHLLDAARDKARTQGYRGALYAWESADTGEEVTPPFAVTPVGDVLPVLTGRQAHHISADIAYAVWQYWQASGDDEFLCNAGAEILIETARFWASRGDIEGDGRYHIRKVIGPDEYHHTVDDNAYTNWMAQWNLECATEATRMLQQRWPQQWGNLMQSIGLQEEEPAQWRDLAARMYTGVLPDQGMIEQFAGYFALEDLDLARFSPRSLPIDVVLGSERTRGTQILKQADVVMLLHLLPARIPATACEANFRYYEPRTEHGSSLSPAIHAAVAARLGDTEMALRYFRQAREIDLADNMGNAAGGVHIAALGGLWQAAVFGFAGLAFDEHGLTFTPHCPAGWHAMRVALTWRGCRLQIRIAPASLEVELVEGTSVPLAVTGTPPVVLKPGLAARWEKIDGAWKESLREHP